VCQRAALLCAAVLSRGGAKRFAHIRDLAADLRDLTAARTHPTESETFLDHFTLLGDQE